MKALVKVDPPKEYTKDIIMVNSYDDKLRDSFYAKEVDLSLLMINYATEFHKAMEKGESLEVNEILNYLSKNKNKVTKFCIGDDKMFPLEDNNFYLLSNGVYGYYNVMEVNTNKSLMLISVREKTSYRTDYDRNGEIRYLSVGDDKYKFWIK